MLQKLIISHYTTTKRYDLIKQHGFKKSLHNELQYQWLGNGVYFFKENEENGRKKGIAIARNKISGLEDKVVELKISIEIPKAEILDFQSDKDVKKMEKIYFDIALEAAKEGFTMLMETKSEFYKIINHVNRFQPFNNQFYGKSLGKFINLIEKKSDEKISAVQAKFYDLKSYHIDDGIYCPQKNENKSTFQICIKNLNYIRLDKYKNDFCIYES